MKRLKNWFINFLVTCRNCHGMGTTETTSGDTKDCAACGGKGFV